MFGLYKGLCYNNKKERGGYSILLVLIIIGLISVAISSSILILGIDFSKTSLTNQRSYQARNLANACAEEALQKINDNLTFTGYGNLNLSIGSCGYFVINSGGQNRTIQASSTLDSVVRKVKININKTRPSLNISSWQEVADF